LNKRGREKHKRTPKATYGKTKKSGMNKAASYKWGGFKMNRKKCFKTEKEEQKTTLSQTSRKGNTPPYS